MRYKVIVSYDGAYFHGFQRQKSYLSVQEAIEDALRDIFKESISIHGAGRTDAGVHARGQVFHFDSNQEIPENGLKRVLNKKLYPHIYIKSVMHTTKEFHAQYSALAKEYIYKISINEFDPLLAPYMHFTHDRISITDFRKASSFFVGTHDFTSFGKTIDKRKTIRTIEYFKVEVEDGIITCKIKGDGFLYNMVRIMIAVCLKAAEGKIKPEDVKTIMENKNRKGAPWVAPACGLYLNEVFYE